MAIKDPVGRELDPIVDQENDTDGWTARLTSIADEQPGLP
jgi:hypothetical protein